MATMKACSISGGATKFIALASATQRMLALGYYPKVYIGVSSGAIVSYFAATGLIEVAIDRGMNMKPEMIWRKSPITGKGRLKLRAYWNLITGKNYIGKMDGLRDMLNRYITEEHHSKYTADKGAADVNVMAVNASTKERKVWNLKKIASHKDVIDMIMASATMPMMGEAVVINGQSYYDGGIRDQNAGHWLLQYYKTPTRIKITELVSIYSRPEDYRLPVDDSWKKNILKLADSFVLNTFNIEISKGDQEKEIWLSAVNGVKLRQVFINKFLISLFDMHPIRMKQGLREGIVAMNKVFNIL